MSGFEGQPIEVDDIIEIFSIDNRSIGLFKITGIVDNDTIILYLDPHPSNIDDTYHLENDELILEISTKETKLFGLSNISSGQMDGLSVKFVGPVNNTELSQEFDNEFNENLLDGLEVENDDNLEEAVKRFRDFWNSDLDFLNLEGLTIEQLPKKYFSHPIVIDKLRYWVFADNKLKNIPEEIGNLHNLHGVNLTNNELTSLPMGIGNLRNLRVLDLGHNELIFLPEQIGNLHNLRYLNISDNKLTSLPEEIGNLHNLQNLSLDNNELTSLPDEIGNLRDLQELHLFDNQLTFLPEEIGNLKNLKNLNIRNNELTSLPISIGNLPKLGRLILINNPLDDSTPRTIPEFRQQWRRYQESSRNIKSAYKN